MYLHNFKQWVEGREHMKGKLCLNFTAADWVVCWMYLPEITGVIGKRKPKYLTFGAIWCIRWSWKGNSLVFSQGGVRIRVVWIIFGPLSISSGSTEQLSTDTNLFRHLCTAGNTCTWVHGLGGRISAWEQPPEGRGLCVQCLPRSHSCSTEPDPWVETSWPCPKSLSRSSPRQSK